jgi:hypothetical protein
LFKKILGQKRPIVVFFDDKDVIDCAVFATSSLFVGFPHSFFVEIFENRGRTEWNLAGHIWGEIFSSDSQRPNPSQLSIKGILHCRTASFEIRLFEFMKMENKFRNLRI